MDTAALSEVLDATVSAVRQGLDELADWGLAGTRPGQYRSDLVADEAAIAVLESAGLGVLSEESGITGGDKPLLAVIDPVDGSTNASHRLPWYATSICVLDEVGPLIAHVANQSSGVHYRAARGEGAFRDGQRIAPSPTTSLRRAFVALSGFPPVHLGWRQYRVLGAAALDICAVADGTLDAYIDSNEAHGVWDYLGAMLVCQEAGAVIGEVHDRDLIVRSHVERRGPVAAATPQLLEEALPARRAAGSRQATR